MDLIAVTRSHLVRKYSLAVQDNKEERDSKKNDTKQSSKKSIGDDDNKHW